MHFSNRWMLIFFRPPMIINPYIRFVWIANPDNIDSYENLMLVGRLGYDENKVD